MISTPKLAVFVRQKGIPEGNLHFYPVALITAMASFRFGLTIF